MGKLQLKKTKGYFHEIWEVPQSAGKSVGKAGLDDSENQLNGNERI